MPAATTFRAIADALGDAGVEIAGDTGKTATERATLLKDVAVSGKAAIEAAQAAALGPNDVEAALTHLADELAAAGFLDEAQTLSVEDLLRVFLAAAAKIPKQKRREEAIAHAYAIAAGRLLWTTQAQESTESEVAKRVAVANRRALDEATQHLQAAGLEIPVAPRSAG